MNFSCDLKLQPRKLRLQPQPASNFFDSASSFVAGIMSTDVVGREYLKESC